MGQNFLITVYIAGDDVEVLACLSLGETGQWNLFHFIAQEQAYLFAHSSSANLAAGIAKAVNDQSKNENNT